MKTIKKTNDNNIITDFINEVNQKMKDLANRLKDDDCKDIDKADFKAKS